MRKLLLLLAFTTSAHAGPLPQADAQFAVHDLREVTLGRLLFYDPVLSGSRDVACATCHHPRFGTSDGVSLGLGDGGIGLGPKRNADPQNLPPRRVARNSPALFNLGAAEFSTLFHDGRLEAAPDQPNGIRTPMGAEMVVGFDGPLAAQAMFPVLSSDEMAGHYGENDISRAVSQGLITSEGGAWEIIAARVAAIPQYRMRFAGVLAANQPIHFTDIANAIAAFIAYEWRADNSPFDQYLREQTPLQEAAMRGLTLFYGKAECDSCHSGQFQTDHQFHAIAMPQIGPGKAAEFESHHRDTGRMRVTGQAADAYHFRTPSLRNLSQTAPYGHSGAYASLEAVVRHHLDPLTSLYAYEIAHANLPQLAQAADTWVLSLRSEMDAIAAANTLPPQHLTETEIADILAFLQTLEDRVARLGVPENVPSGLPVLR